MTECFSPEFLGRLDGVIPFRPLADGAMEAIAWKYLHQLQDRVKAMGTQLLLPPELAAQLGQRCRGKEGARQLRRLIQKEVEGPLAGYLLGCSRRPTRVRVKMEGEEICFLS